MNQDSISNKQVTSWIGIGVKRQSDLVTDKGDQEMRVHGSTRRLEHLMRLVQGNESSYISISKWRTAWDIGGKLSVAFLMDSVLRTPPGNMVTRGK